MHEKSRVDSKNGEIGVALEVDSWRSTIIRIVTNRSGSDNEQFYHNFNWKGKRLFFYFLWYYDSDCVNIAAHTVVLVMDQL